VQQLRYVQGLQGQRGNIQEDRGVAMKKAFIAITAILLLYGFIRELNFMNVLLMLGGLGTIYAIYRTPARYIEAMKYPLIILSFLVTVLFFVYPKVPLVYPARVAIVFLSFYSVIFYIVNMEDKQKEFFKEITALSILFISSSFNLFMTGQLLLIISFALALILILFILDRTPMVPFIAGYTLIAGVLIYRQSGNILGSGLTGLGSIEKYILLSSSFVFLLTSFIMFMKKNTVAKMLPFFGFLYIAMDTLMVLGVKLSTGLLYQPVIFLVLVSPLIGVMLKTEGERA
jgi:hypothetical protein